MVVKFDQSFAGRPLTERELGARADGEAAAGRHSCRRVGPSASFLQARGFAGVSDRQLCPSEVRESAHGAAEAGCDGP